MQVSKTTAAVVIVVVVVLAVLLVWSLTGKGKVGGKEDAAKMSPEAKAALQQMKAPGPSSQQAPVPGAVPPGGGGGGN